MAAFLDWVLPAAGVVALVAIVSALPYIVRRQTDAWVRRSIESHDRRTRYVLAQMRLVDRQAEREVDDAVRRISGRNRHA